MIGEKKMSKAILVIDMPKSCYECQLCVKDDYEEQLICTGEYRSAFDTFHTCINEFYKRNMKPNWCPLKPMPNKAHIFDIYKDYTFSTEEEQKAYMIGNEDGYNDCIREILGEEE